MKSCPFRLEPLCVGPLWDHGREFSDENCCPSSDGVDYL